jgi:tRNA-specific adenosine deaminase 3
MAQTGGLTAEMASNDSGPVGLGYGLCWRKELNWQFMCWEYIEPKDKDTGNVEPDDDDPEAGDQKSVVMLNDDNANVNSFASSTHV